MPSLSAQKGAWRLACTWAQRPVVVDPKASLLGDGFGAFPVEDRPPPIRVGTLHFLIPQGMRTGLCTQPVLNWEWSLSTWGWRPDFPGLGPEAPVATAEDRLGSHLLSPALPGPADPLPTELPGLVPRAGQSQSPGSYPRLADSWFPQRRNPGLLWPALPLLESAGWDMAPAL